MVNVRKRRNRAGRLLKGNISDVESLDEGLSPEHKIEDISQQLHSCHNRIQSSLEEQRKSREVIEDLQSKVNNYRIKSASAKQNLGSTSSLLLDTSLNITIPQTTFSNVYDTKMSTTPHDEHDVNKIYSKDNMDTDKLTSMINAGFSSMNKNITLQTTTSCHNLVDSSTPISSHHHYSSDNINFNLRNGSKCDMFCDKQCCGSNFSLGQINTLEQVTHLLEEEQKKNAYLENILEISKMHAESTLIANQGYVNDVNRLQYCLMVCETEKKDREEYLENLTKNYKNFLKTVHVEAHKLSNLYGDLKNEIFYLKSESKRFKEYQNQFCREITKSMEKNIFDSLLSIMKKKTNEVADNEKIIEMISNKFEEASLENARKEEKFYEIQKKLQDLHGVVKRIKEDRDKAFDTIVNISKMPELSNNNRKIIIPKQKSGNEAIVDTQVSESIEESYNFNVNFNDFTIAIRSSFKSLKNEIENLKVENNSLRKQLTNVKSELETTKLTSINFEKELVKQSESNEEMVQLKVEKDKVIKRLEERILKLESEKEEKQLKINDYIKEVTELKEKHQSEINELFERQRNFTDGLIKQYEFESDEKDSKNSEIIKRFEKNNENLRKELEHTRNELRDTSVDKNSMTRKIQQLENSLLEKENKLKIIQDDLEREKTLHYEDKLKILLLEEENEKANSEADEIKELRKDLEHKNIVLSEDINIFKKQINDMQEKISDINKLNEKLRNSTEDYQRVIGRLDKELSEANEQVFNLKTENATISSNLEMYEGKEKIWNSEKKSLRDEIEHNLEIISNLNSEKGQLIKEVEQLHSTFQECEDKMTEDNKLIEELASKLQNEVNIQQNIIKENNESNIAINELKEKILLLENKVSNKEREFDELQMAENDLKKEITKFEELKSCYEKEKKVGMENKNLVDDLSFKLNEALEKLEMYDSILVQKNNLDKAIENLKKEHQSLIEEVTYEKDNNYQLSSSLAVAEKKLSKSKSLLKDLEDKLEETQKALNEKVHEEDELRLTIDDLHRQLTEESRKNNDLKDEKENLIYERENLKKHLSHKENELFMLNTKLSEKKERYDNKKEELLIVNEKLKNIEEELNKSLKQVDYWKETNQNKVVEYERKIEKLSEDKEKLLYLEDSCEELEKLNDNLLKEIASFKHLLEEEKKANSKTVDELTMRITQLEREKYEVLRFSDEKVIDIELLKNKIGTLSEKLAGNDIKNKQLQDKCYNYIDKLRNYELAFEEASSYILEMEKYNDDMESNECPLGYINCRLPRIPYRTKITESRKIRFSSAEGLTERKSNLNTLTGSMCDINQCDFATQVFERFKRRIEDLEQERTNYRIQIQNLRTELNIVSKNSKNVEGKLEENVKSLNRLKKEKNDLENELKNARQLYLVQEENKRAKENEKKSLKAKIVSADLHSRDKETRLQISNNTINQLQDENNRLKGDIEEILKREQRLLLEKDLLENQLCNIKTEMEITRQELNIVEREKRTVTTTYHNFYKKTSKTIESPVNSDKLKLHLKELEKLIQNKKKLLQKLETEEFRRMNRGDLKNAHFEILQLESRLDTFKVEFSVLVEKYKNCESEKSTLKKDLVDSNNQLSTAKIKINDLQIAINNLETLNKRAEEKLSLFEKSEKDILQLNQDLHNEVNHTRNEKLKLIGEIEELKRRYLCCDVERRELEAYKNRLEREKSSLILTIETLESDKNKLDGCHKKVLSEKATLDKNLSTIKKENSELNKNLFLLQNQKYQIEKELSNKQAENLHKRKTEAEIEINRLNEEKRQLEKMYNQRDHNYNKKITALNQEINSLKITLEVERKKRLEQLKSVNTGKGVSALTNKFETISYKK